MTGTSSGADRAGLPDLPDPVDGRRPTIPPALLMDRAMQWHRLHLGRACECNEGGRGHYPCGACRREVLELVTLLDQTVRDTIRVVMSALERMT